MKYILFILLPLYSLLTLAQGQTKNPNENVVITYKENNTLVRTDENGKLLINVSKKDFSKIKANGMVRYSDFGASGDGKTDDMDAIAAAHEFANQHDLSVKADNGARYYISGKNRTAVIMTNTDFGTADFIIDDTNVENRNASVFLVSSLRSSGAAMNTDPICPGFSNPTSFSSGPTRGSFHCREKSPGDTGPAALREPRSTQSSPLPAHNEQSANTLQKAFIIDLVSSSFNEWTGSQYEVIPPSESRSYISAKYS